MTLVLIPPGEFGMGANATDFQAEFYERPHHRVKLTRAFDLGATEVTQGEYKTVMEGKNPSQVQGNDSLPGRKPELDGRGRVLQRPEPERRASRILSDRRGQCGGAKLERGRIPAADRGGMGVRLSRRSDTLYWFGDNPDELKNHAWVGRGRDNRPSSGNSGDQTHPAGARA